MADLRESHTNFGRTQMLWTVAMWRGRGCETVIPDAIRPASAVALQRVSYPGSRVQRVATGSCCQCPRSRWDWSLSCARRMAVWGDNVETVVTGLRQGQLRCVRQRRCGREARAGGRCCGQDPVTCRLCWRRDRDSLRRDRRMKRR
jgi:hypothetical protein